MVKNQICIAAYENDYEVICVGNLAITNHPDVITLEGVLSLTKDQKGLEYAFALKRQIDTIVDTLKREDLPPLLHT
jgi:pantothenate kinase